MTGIHFIDRNGVQWMVVGGLPDAHPAAHVGDVAGPFTGLTFVASTGAMRVLTAEAMRGVSTADSIGQPVPAARSQRAPSAHWEELLSRATPWPLA